MGKDSSLGEKMAVPDAGLDDAAGEREADMGLGKIRNFQLTESQERESLDSLDIDAEGFTDTDDGIGLGL